MQASRKLKIIQLSTFFHPSVGGVERQAEEIAIHLVQDGHEVTVFTTDATHGKEKRMQRLADTYHGVPVKRFRYLISLGNFFRFAPNLIWNLWTADFDIVHVHNVHDGHLLAAIIVRLLRRKKLVITGHNPYVVNAEKRGSLLHRLVGVYEWFIKLFHSGIDLYIALVETEKQYVAKHFRVRDAKIVVIPNGIQDLFYVQDGNREKFYSEWEIDRAKWQLVVGTVSRLNYVKGIQNLLLAVRQLPQVLFIFAGGDDGYYTQLRKIFNQYPNVLFTEAYLPSEEVKDFYQAIDIFLLPSQYEPFGMTVIEAMAQGKMVLATNKGGTLETIKPEFGELLEPSDQQLWADRIKFYSENPNAITEKSASAAAAAQQYRWENVISQIEKAYESLM